MGSEHDIIGRRLPSDLKTLPTHIS